MHASTTGAGAHKRGDHRRRRTVRLRLTVVYGGLFILAGASLLTITGLLWSNATSSNVAIQRSVPFNILRIANSNGPALKVLPASAKLGSGGPFTSPASGARPLLGPLANSRQVSAIQNQLTVVAKEQRNSDRSKLLLYAGIAFAAVALLTIVLSWIAAGRILRPLRTITSRARAISASNLHERLDLEGPSDELGELGETIDELLGRLERAFEAQRLFVANASHELRTPLATMRASVDVAVAKPGPTPPELLQLASRLNVELDQVDRLLGSFLALARAEASDGTGEDPVRFDLLVAEATAHQLASGLADDVDLAHAPGQPAWVLGDSLLLRRLVDNLLDNAVRHNEPGGRVEVRLEKERTVVRLVVENDGGTLDPAAVADLGSPFRRLGADRVGTANGFGLGLSIVHAIAMSHGGRVTLSARSEGGLRASVELPLAARSLSVVDG